MFRSGLLVCLSLQITENRLAQIFLKLSGRVKHEPGKNPFNFGADPNQGSGYTNFADSLYKWVAKKSSGGGER